MVLDRDGDRAYVLTRFDNSISIVDLRARAWVSNSDWWDVRCDTLKKVKEGFDKAGITIPYPHQVTVTRGDPHVGPATENGAKVKDAT